jgi:glycosyltransferase involved in cell wall biosynthesis
LVVKAINGDKHELSTLIEEKIRLTPNMIYIDEVLDKYNMKLLIENSLGVISLHRSEGYGLGLLNAMYLGKFVIATNYSGNLEFMTSDNSELIDFSMISTGNLASQIYRETQSRWANPNLDDFIDKIRNCYFNENYRRKKGESAKLSVSHKINSSKVASQFRGLLV